MFKSVLFMMTVRGVAVLAILQLLAIACTGGYSDKKNPVASKGIMDLHDWNFDRDGPVFLSGQWAFYWKQLLRGHELQSDALSGEHIPVPGIWNGLTIQGQKLKSDGYATYRLKVLLPAGCVSAGGEKLALIMHGMGTAYSLFINGVLAGKGGIVGESAETSFPGYWPDVVEYAPKGKKLDLALQISNYHHRKGGAREKIMLGTASMIRDMREKSLACEFFLFGSIFLMGAYHMLLFSLRKMDRSYLYFGLFCMLIAARIMVTGECYMLRMSPRISWDWIIGTEYLTVYAGVPIFFLFVHSMFPEEFARKVLAGIIILGALFCGIVLAVPSRFYTYTMQPYQVLSFGICLYGLWALIRALVRKREGALPFLAGFIIMFITVINDFLYNNMMIQTGFLVPYGLFVFIFPQAFLLSFRFSQAYIAVERLTGELKQYNRKLIIMDTVKDEFLAMVSHELQSPLNGIIGITESMIDGRHGMLSVESKFNLGLIAASGRRLVCLVNDILDFVRLKNSVMDLNRRPVEMKAVADIVITFTRPLIGGKKLALVNNITADSPTVFADENRILQVLHNLVGNAVKFTPAGCIAIAARAAKKNGWMEFSVSDMGIGMEPERLDRIFNSFRFEDADIPRNGGCIGIGLSIARQIVELHGGSIWAESKPGKGSVFTFTLPVYRDEGNQIAARKDARQLITAQQPPVAANDLDPLIKAAPESGMSGRLLIVDDDILNMQIMRNYLFAEDYSVVTAASGPDALDCIRSGDFDLVLLDLMISGMSGHELCSEIRKRFSLFQLPVIMLTARYGITELVAGFDCGANDYLIKPAHRDELLARVKTLVTLKKTVQDHDEAKYNLLQERMNPHFLFNALNTVHAMINKDRSQADRAVIMLADNYRFLIDHSFRSLIPFDAEWRFVENFLDLEQMRYRDFLVAKLERRGDFGCINIPPLTLQPLVENALKHGIQRSGSHSMIRVFAESDGGFLRMVVQNSGAGFEPVDFFSRSLGNIRSRLNYYFTDVEFDVDYDGDCSVIVRVSFRFENAFGRKCRDGEGPYGL